jgi:EmrB/QacA subfamily drug resistance transporter
MEQERTAPAPAAESAAVADQPAADTAPAVTSTKKGWRFWAVFPALCITALLAAVESTVVSTALPSIVHEISAGEDYVWILNVYLLTSCAFLPLIGQMSNIWGRRSIMILVVCLFALGSGIAGGSTNLAMLIAGRAIQGIGGGGVNLVIQLIVCDLVPLRERGNYMAAIFLFFTIGTAMGPFIGGIIVERTSWRWVFYINLPIAGAALVLHVLFLRLHHERTGSLSEKLRRIDYAGNAILMMSVVSVLIALTWGGTRYSWGSYRIVVPLVLGLLGIIGFHIYEMAPWVKVPILPERLFKRRTPAAALVIAFIDFLLLYWLTIFLPVYLQAVKGRSPLQSGVDFLPSSLISVFTGVVSGRLLSVTGRYKAMHFVSFIFMSLGLGLFSRFDADTSKAEYIGIQIIFALGLGFLMTSNLPAVQADLPDSDAAVSAAAFNFMRSYGAIWGVSIPSAIFNARCSQEAWRISDPVVRGHLSGGDAYGYVTSSARQGLDVPAEVQAEVVDVYTRSLRLLWQVGLAFSLLGFILVFFEKEILLRTTLDTKYGLKEKEKDKSEPEVESGPVEKTGTGSDGAEHSVKSE